MIYRKILSNYPFYAFSYGLIRKTSHLKNAKITEVHYDKKLKEYKKKQIPVLLIDKIGILTYSSFITFFILPLYIYSDLKKLEIKCNNLNYELYNLFDDEEQTYLQLLFK